MKLNRVVPEGAAEVWVKCEYLNPAGSIKDRMANYIIDQAEKKGILKPGGRIAFDAAATTAPASTANE